MENLSVWAKKLAAFELDATFKDSAATFKCTSKASQWRPQFRDCNIPALGAVWQTVGRQGALILQVTVFSTSEKKREEALKTLKADHFIVSKDEEQMKVRLPSHLHFLSCDGFRCMCAV